MSKRRRSRVRLAEEPGPPVELEAAVETRMDGLFVEAVERHLGRTLSEDDREALLERVHDWKVYDEDEKAEVVPPDNYDDLGAAGVLAGDELRELEMELRERMPGHAHGYGPSLPPFEPTQAEPGSEEKIRVMRRRFLARQSLHHPQDKRLARGIFAAGLETPKGEDR